MHDALSKRQLETSFRVRRSKEHHESAIFINFHFSNPKLSQERRFFLSISYINLCTRHYAKEAIDSFFGRAI